MDVELIAVDLDGTVVQDGKIAEEDKEALEKVIEKGYPVVPATTRLRFSSLRLVGDLPVHEFPIVCNNGARVLGSGWDDPDKVKEYRNIKLEPKISEDLISRGDEMDHKYSVIFDEMVCRTRQEENSEKDPMVRFLEKNSKVSDYGTPINFMIHRSENDLETLKDVRRFVTEKYGPKVRVDGHHYKNALRTLTIYDNKVDKASGLRLVCDKMGISFDKVLTIGDDQVDLEMIREAGTGIAMEDAPTEVKEAADEIAPTVEENGVSKILEEYILR